MGGWQSTPEVEYDETMIMPEQIMDILGCGRGFSYPPGSLIRGQDAVDDGLEWLRTRWTSGGVGRLAALYSELCDNGRNTWPPILSTRASRLAATLLLWARSGDEGVTNAIAETNHFFSFKVAGQNWINARSFPAKHICAISVLQVTIITVLFGIPVGNSSPLHRLREMIGICLNKDARLLSTNKNLPEHVNRIGFWTEYELIGALVLLRTLGREDSYKSITGLLTGDVLETIARGVAIVEQFNKCEPDAGTDDPELLCTMRVGSVEVPELGTLSSKRLAIEPTLPDIIEPTAPSSSNSTSTLETSNQSRPKQD